MFQAGPSLPASARRAACIQLAGLAPLWYLQRVQLLSIEGDYALRAVIYLSCQPKEKISYVSEIARDQLIPVNFLFKILRKLVKHGLVKSYRGPHGGYKLAREASDITFLEIIEAVEGPIVVNRCMSEAAQCLLEKSCTMLSAWQRIQDHVVAELKTITINDLVSIPDKKRI